MSDEETIDWCEKATKYGADEAKLIDPAIVVTAPWVRRKCQFGCDGYGQGLTCPPHSPTYDETQRMLDQYGRAILVRAHSVGLGEDEERSLARMVNRAVTNLERDLFLNGHYRAYSFGGGPCYECDPCDVTQPCRNPERARPSMEASGIDVYATVRNAGWEIEVVPDRKSPFQLVGLVLID